MRSASLNETKEHEQEHGKDGARVLVDVGTIDVQFRADEVLALYLALEQTLSSLIRDGSSPLERARDKIEARLTLSMQVTSALTRNRRTRPLTELIKAALVEIDRDAVSCRNKRQQFKRYARAQQDKISALVEQQGVEHAAQEHREQDGPLPDDAVVDVDTCLFDDDVLARDYPRRRPPVPVMPTLHRCRARRRGRSRPEVTDRV